MKIDKRYQNAITFADGNERIVVADPYNDDFIFWDMRNYKKLYEISKQEFLEMRISDGTVVFFRLVLKMKLSIIKNIDCLF